MAEISSIILPNGQQYDFKDAKAREDIAGIQSAIAGGLTFLGETTTALSEGSTDNPIVINGENVTAMNGALAVYGKKEFLFNGTKWLEMGDLSILKALAYKDSASGKFTPSGNVSQPTFTGSESAVTITAADNANGNYQPKGTVSKPDFTGTATTSTGKFTPDGTVTVSTKTTSNKTATVAPAASGDATYTPGGTVTQPTFTGTATTSTGKFTPAGSVGLTTTNKTAEVSKAASGTATYTPEGTVAAPTISVSTAGSTTKVNSITAVGTLPNLTTTVANEVLTIGWDAGTLPTKGADTTVKTGDAAYTATAPKFTGTGARLVTGNIAVPTSASFTGTEGDVSVSGTPKGSVSQPTFTGTKAQLSGTTTASGTVSKPTFTGTEGTVTVS